MNWFQNKPLSLRIKLVVIVNFILLIFAYLFVSRYKLFTILITSILLCYLSFKFFNSFVCLINLTDSDNLSAERKFQLNFYTFLFKNKHIYQLVKKLVKYKLNWEDIFESSHNTDKFVKIDQILAKQIESLVKNISENFIETWYFANVSHNSQFITETKIQLEHILKDLIDRFDNINKIDLFSKAMLILNKNFVDFSINNELCKTDIPVQKLHPAVRNQAESEKIFIKKLVLIVLRKSGNILDINNQFIEELFMQLIGKNCIQKVVDLVSQPSFVYFAICCALEKEKTFSARAEINDQSQEVFFSGSDDDFEPIDLSDSASCKNDNYSAQKILAKSELSMKNPLYENDNNSSNLFLEIFNIGIIGSETSKEPKTGKEFTNYLIKFEYKFSSTSMDLNKDCGNESSQIKTKQIRRRFKEFVSLQKSLEDQFHLKNFKGPSKFNSPIGNMESEIVEKRRLRLNKYLNSLICLTEICQSNDFINFLGLSNTEQVKSGQSVSIFKSVSESFFDRNSSKLDPIVNFANILPNSFEYSKEESYFKFHRLLTNLLKETKNMYENFSKNDCSIETKPSIETNLGKNLLEIVNKLLTSASLINNLPTQFWFNQKKVYRLLECTIFEFYAERFFEDQLNRLLSKESLNFYLQTLESCLFNNNNNQIKYSDPDYQNLLENMLNEKIPDLFKKIFGRRLDLSISVFISCFKHEILNKHFIYNALEVFLMFMYPEEYEQNKF